MPEDLSGYEDTPLLPASEYRVHDPDRPDPPIVSPDRAQTADLPGDVTVLFDGTDMSDWESVDGGAPEWSIADEALVVDLGTSDILTRTEIGDCRSGRFILTTMCQQSVS